MLGLVMSLPRVSNKSTAVLIINSLIQICYGRGRDKAGCFPFSSSKIQGQTVILAHVYSYLGVVGSQLVLGCILDQSPPVRHSNRQDICQDSGFVDVC